MGFQCETMITRTFCASRLSKTFACPVSGGYQSFSSVLRRAFLFVTWVH